MKRKKYSLVVNMKSRQSARAVDEVKRIFKSHKIVLKIMVTDKPAQLNRLFQKAIDTDSDVIVLGGGDGTLISGIEYLSKQNYSGDIGLLPLGTANYLARDLSIPLDFEESIRTILRGQTREIPLGVANDKYFALMLILGLTQVTAEQVSDSLKRRFGQLAYVLELFRQTAKHKPFNYTIESPDLQKPLTGLTHQIIVYNSDMNQQLKLMPDHKLTHPSLKVVVSRTGRSKLKLYISFLLHILTAGKVRRYMYVFETDRLRLVTDPALPGDYDGEVHGKSPFEISMNEHKVRVIC